jgi:nicotinamidase/pyrazinamidase
MTMKLKKALLVVDMQNDFCPGGALGVLDGDKIIPAINNYIKIFSKAQLPVFATRDWHPEETNHFKKYGGAWPVHCLGDTKGAQFHPKLKLPKEAVLLFKGMDPKQDSYSAFHAQDAAGESFLNLLKIFGIKEIYICGLATDYCVRFSAREAIKFGFKVKVLIDAIKGVNLRPDDSENALKEMEREGVKFINLKSIKIGSSNMLAVDRS